jgi:hypothetical protein
LAAAAITPSRLAAEAKTLGIQLPVTIEENHCPYLYPQSGIPICG